MTPDPTPDPKSAADTPTLRPGATAVAVPFPQARDVALETALAVCPCADGTYIAWWGVVPPEGWDAWTLEAYPEGGGIEPPYRSGDSLEGARVLSCVPRRYCDLTEEEARKLFNWRDDCRITALAELFDEHADHWHDWFWFVEVEVQS